MEKEINLGLDMNDIYQVLAYVDDDNLIVHDIKTIERNADVLLNTSKEICLTLNIEKIK